MRRAALMLLPALLLTGCDTSNYAFKVDKSISILQPKARKEVRLPVVVEWTDSTGARGLRVAPANPDAEYYGVFVDVAPLGPGKRLARLVEHSESCDIRMGCPSAQQLADVGVHLTASTRLVLEFVADLRPSTRGSSKDVHEIIIVRMRGDKRVGEGAFRRTFFVDR